MQDSHRSEINLARIPVLDLDVFIFAVFLILKQHILPVFGICMGDGIVIKHILHFYHAFSRASIIEGNFLQNDHHFRGRGQY